MGANFVPSNANLTMGYWKLQHITHNNPFTIKVIYFGRYIDDIVIIWDGTRESMESIVQYCNNNPLGLSCTHVMHPDKLAFLDIELYHSEFQIPDICLGGPLLNTN